MNRKWSDHVQVSQTPLMTNEAAVAHLWTKGSTRFRSHRYRSVRARPPRPCPCTERRRWGLSSCSGEPVNSKENKTQERFSSSLNTKWSINDLIKTTQTIFEKSTHQLWYLFGVRHLQLRFWRRFDSDHGLILQALDSPDVLVCDVRICETR